MILDAMSGYDFSEEDIKFVNLLARKADRNILVTIENLNELKEEMEKEGISTNNFKELCRKMQDNSIIKYHEEGGHIWITLNSTQVVGFQSHLKNISCPKCHKLPLRKKTITYCPGCNYESDKN
jgi:hypothetical protein